jgi:FlaA1/EpsC-like NDP-sugar epimerase
MGRPVRILDLAKDLISLSGLRPHEDVEIVFSGVRPGEKLFEELEIDEECLAKTRHPKIFIGKIAVHPPEHVRAVLARLAALSATEDEGELRRCLGAFLPEAQLTHLERTAPRSLAVGRAEAPESGLPN